MRKLLVFLSVVALVLLAAPLAAFAQTGTPGNPADVGLPTSWSALVCIIVIGFVTPHIVAFAAAASAPDWLTGPLSAVVAAAGSITAYLVDVNGVPDWKHVVGLFLTAEAAALIYRKQVDPGTVAPLWRGGLQLGAGRQPDRVAERVHAA